MPIETIANGEFRYPLVSFDRDGVERPEGGGLFSDSVVQTVVDQPVTDVILISHGWNGDLSAAREQYGRWISAMLDCAADRAAMAARVDGFSPLVIGLHWPSKAWGDEDFGGAGTSFAANVAGAAAPAMTIDTLVDRYAALLSGTAMARAALRTIFEAASEDIMPDTMPPDVAEAYAILDAEIQLGAQGAGAAPGSDREPFDAVTAYEETLDEEEDASFGGSGLGGLLAPLRTLTFWHMKRRACRFGESGATALLRRLQSAVPEDRRVRFHLMGHSFGCIVVSAAVAGGPGRAACAVDTLVLVQGALSLWSYCGRIPGTRARSGYFHRIVADKLVRGPVVTTMSQHDRAVGFFYPLGAAAGRQVSYPIGEYPTYGGIGSFGARGLPDDTDDLHMREVTEPYDFHPDRIYNLESSHVIAHGGGASGAHSDICHPQVAHAVWSAIATTA
jgi:pimeloyl-ACP methyl ester carboxylesterase